MTKTGMRSAALLLGFLCNFSWANFFGSYDWIISVGGYRFTDVEKKDRYGMDVSYETKSIGKSDSSSNSAMGHGSIRRIYDVLGREAL